MPEGYWQQELPVPLWVVLWAAEKTTLPDFQIIQRLTVYKPIQSLDCGEFTLGNLASPRVWSNGCWTLEAIAAPFLAH